VVVILEDEPTDKKGNSIITKTKELSEEWSYNWRRKYETAISKGAIAVITIVKDYENKKQLVASTFTSTKLFLEKEEGSDGSIKEPPRIYVSSKIGIEMFNKSGKSLEKVIDDITRSGKPKSQNISASIKI